MVELFAKWSTPCVALDRALRDPSVAPVLADHFVTLRFDVSDSTDEDAALRERYAVQGEPMLVFVAPDGSVVGRVATYLDPPQLASDITAAAARLAR